MCTLQTSPKTYGYLFPIMIAYILTHPTAHPVLRARSESKFQLDPQIRQVCDRRDRRSRRATRVHLAAPAVAQRLVLRRDVCRRACRADTRLGAYDWTQDGAARGDGV